MYNEFFDLNVRDSDYGVVVGNCSKGVFIELSNGDTVFSYFAGLEVGTKVLCTVIRRAINNQRPLASIDSVLNDYEFAA